MYLIIGPTKAEDNTRETRLTAMLVIICSFLVLSQLTDALLNLMYVAPSVATEVAHLLEITSLANVCIYCGFNKLFRKTLLDMSHVDTQ